MEEKLLSISIASYNAQKTLERAVSSCIVADKKMLEKLDIIIVNDGSKDNTYQIAEDLKNKFLSVRVVHKANGGYGSTVNAAINVAKGKYFKLLDADDWYNTDDFLKLLYELENTDSDMVITNYTEVKNKEKCLITYRDNIETYKDMENLSEHFSMHAVMYKTEILKRNNIKLDENILYTDTEFVAYPLMFVNSVTFFPYNIYQYSLHGEGQSVAIDSRIKHIKDAEIIVNSLEMYIERMNSKKTINDVYWNKLVDASKFYINSLLLAGNKESKEKLKEFDKYLKMHWQYVYKNSFNIIIKVLRNTNYVGYGICGFVLKKTLK